MITTVTLNTAIDKLYLVDEYIPYEVMRVKECTYTPGGKGLNVTKVLHLLNEEVVATGFIGGYAGEWILEALSSMGINHQFIKTEGETRSCINIKDLSTGKHTEFLEPGPSLDQSYEELFLNTFSEITKDSKVVTVSGSIPKGISQDIYSKIITLCKENGKKIIMDTSGKLLEEVIEKGPTMIKPNIDELRAITKEKIDTIDEIVKAAESIRQKGVSIVAVSLGKDGVLVVCDEGVYHGIPPKIEAVNTVGCGDSMLAGFAAGISREEGIIDIIKKAVAVSAANALTSQTGYFEIDDYKRLLSEVVVKKL